MSKITTRGLGSAAARNLKFVLVPALLACTSLTGCGGFRQAFAGDGKDELVSAQSIDLTSIPVYNQATGSVAPTNVVSQSSVDSDGAHKVEFLGAVVGDSEKKCGAFVNGLVRAETAVDATGDIAGTVFSALATAFTPPGTKTALSAAATIATGSKADIDNDVYAKAAISDFATAIQKTYYTDVQTYTDNLSKLTGDERNSLIMNNEIDKILSIHAECGLAPAESAIQAKLGTTKGQEQQLPGNSQNGGGNPNQAQHALKFAGPHGQQTPTEEQNLPPTRGAIPGTAW